MGLGLSSGSQTRESIKITVSTILSLNHSNRNETWKEVSGARLINTRISAFGIINDHLGFHKMSIEDLRGIDGGARRGRLGNGFNLPIACLLA